MSTASLRFVVFAGRKRPADPVALADFGTAVADLRAAVCLEAGVDQADISSLGYDHSNAAYERVRAGWVSHIRQWGITLHDHSLTEAYGLWLAARPDLATGDDWRADGAKLHREAYLDGGCFYGSGCVLCCLVADDAVS
jgi:hypothetical protein